MDWKTTRTFIDLIWLSEINILICANIYKKYGFDKEKARDSDNFWLLVANNSCHEAISLLHTLLESSNKDEWAIKPVIKLIQKEGKDSNPSLDYVDAANELRDKMIAAYPNPMAGIPLEILNREKIRASIKIAARSEACRRFKNISELFRNGKFTKIRNQLTDHKDIRQKDPDGAVRMLISNDMIIKLTDIVNRLVVESYFWFGCTLTNRKLHLLNEILGTK